MKRILILASAIIVVLGIISCQSQAATGTAGKCDGCKPGQPCQSKTPCADCKAEKDQAMKKKHGQDQPGMPSVADMEKVNEAMEKVKRFYDLNEKVNECFDTKEYDKALELLLNINKEFPGDPTVLYNTACVYSLQNKRSESLSYLDKAVRAGWYDWKFIDQDKDLENIRGEDGFKEIRNGLEKKYPEGAPAHNHGNE